MEEQQDGFRQPKAQGSYSRLQPSPVHWEADIWILYVNLCNYGTSIFLLMYIVYVNNAAPQ